MKTFTWANKSFVPGLKVEGGYGQADNFVVEIGRYQHPESRNFVTKQILLAPELLSLIHAHRHEGKWLNGRIPEVLREICPRLLKARVTTLCGQQVLSSAETASQQTLVLLQENATTRFTITPRLNPEQVIVSFREKKPDGPFRALVVINPNDAITISSPDAHRTWIWTGESWR